MLLIKKLCPREVLNFKNFIYEECGTFTQKNCKIRNFQNQNLLGKFKK